MSTVISLNKARPKVASWDRACLPDRMAGLLPAAVTVLVTPFWTDAGDEPVCRYWVTAWAADGRRIAVDPDTAAAAVAWMQAAFPTADWRQAQLWRADTNQLGPWQPATWGRGGAA